MQRGLCRLQVGEFDSGMNDLHDLTADVNGQGGAGKIQAAGDRGLHQAEQILMDHQNYQFALEAMADEQSLSPTPDTGFHLREARAYEQRAAQVEQSIPDATGGGKIRRQQQVPALRTRAGDEYVAYSSGLTLVDDTGYADALWKGMDLYDQAGNLQATIAALELFVAERPSDKQAPDALLRLGRTYQAAGMADQAITVFQRNQIEHPKSLAASKSAVPLAQAYIAKGPDFYARAERHAAERGARQSAGRSQRRGIPPVPV